jgi:ribosomal protein S3
VNSFFILTLITGSENVLLDILRMMMPRIRKIRRFMFFLDSVIKHMRQMQVTFGCFKITLTGKIRGGTQRTKTLVVGHGRLPYQSLHIEGASAFVSYRHKFGAFGVKLLFNRAHFDKIIV